MKVLVTGLKTSADFKASASVPPAASWVAHLCEQRVSVLIPSVDHVSDGRKNVSRRIDYLSRLQGPATSHTAGDKDGPAWHECGRVACPIFVHGIVNGPSLSAGIVGFVSSEKPTLKRRATDGSKHGHSGAGLTGGWTGERASVSRRQKFGTRDHRYLPRRADSSRNNPR